MKLETVFVGTLERGDPSVETVEELSIQEVKSPMKIRTEMTDFFILISLR